MKKIIFMFLIVFSIHLYSQEASFIDDLSTKKNATFSDCVKMFCFMYNVEVTDEFSQNVKNLSKFVKYFPKGYSANKKLTVGNFSLFAVQYLKINGGLFYLATKSGRYATRELIFRDILLFNTSEYEEISGVDLIRFIHKVVDYEEKHKN
ncbi:MAG: hypothetical protein A2086_12370 [Spirochaetes bacterium GWD1_27_9]|nr:MAG: hypothetical protein A2Z98_11305 [Spirochaetes bacterium GWB1_27_13]OHD23882.1 MAG: hypothetical protein A2Y34_06550 [Spirochaetes bacterium GWC1_27_15]OHD35611.1 MAG: hypothetical protein A2086_12370 [Spirochaetes bacterium GWD1_27_9]